MARCGQGATLIIRLFAGYIMIYPLNLTCFNAEISIFEWFFLHQSANWLAQEAAPSLLVGFQASPADEWQYPWNIAVGGDVPCKIGMYQGIIMCHYWEQNDWNSDWNQTLYFQHFCENSSGNVWITAQFQSAADISTLPHPSILTCAMGQKLPEKRSWSRWIFGQGQFWNGLNP